MPLPGLFGASSVKATYSERFDSRTGVGNDKRPARHGHWFWSVIGAQRFVYRDVLAAAAVEIEALAMEVIHRMHQVHGDGVEAPQLIAEKALPERTPSSWIARATSSLPVPLSPSMSARASVGATVWMSCRSFGTF